MFAMGDPERIREMVSGSGFDEPEVEEIEFDFRYADFDEVWAGIVRLAGPLAEAIEGLAEDERDATQTAILEGMAPYRADDGSYTTPAMSWGVSAG